MLYCLFGQFNLILHIYKYIYYILHIYIVVKLDCVFVMYFILLFAASTLNTDVIMYSLSEEQINTIMDPSNLTSSITITPAASDSTTESTCNLVKKVKSCYNPLRLGTVIVLVSSGTDFVNTPLLYSDRATR